MTTKDEATTVENEPQVPAGFQQADTDVDNYDAWDFDKLGVLIGVVQKVKTVELIRRGEPVDVRMAVVLTADGELCVLWESANLGDFFDQIAAESSIQVVPAGEQILSGNRSMKLYRAYYR